MTVDSFSANFKVTWHKKTMPNIKHPARSNLYTVSQIKNPWSVASSYCKWRRRYRLKKAGFPTLKGSWPWPWPWIGVILHTVVQQSSTSTYIPNFTEIEETVCGRTDIRMYVRCRACEVTLVITDTLIVGLTYLLTYVHAYVRTYPRTDWRTDGHLRPASFGRLCRRVDLKPGPH